MKIITKIIMLTSTFSIPYCTGGSNQIKKKDAEETLKEQNYHNLHITIFTKSSKDSAK